MTTPSFTRVLALHALGLLDADEAAAVELALRFDAASSRIHRAYLGVVGDLALACERVAPSQRVYARLAAGVG